MTSVETPLWAAIRCEDAESNFATFAASAKIPAVNELAAEVGRLSCWTGEPIVSQDSKPGEDIVFHFERKKGEGAPSWTNIAQSVLELVNRHQQTHRISQLEWQADMPECMVLNLDQPASLPYNS